MICGILQAETAIIFSVRECELGPASHGKNGGVDMFMRCSEVRWGEIGMDWNVRLETRELRSMSAIDVSGSRV